MERYRMTPLHILVYDDMPERSAKWAATIRAVCNDAIVQTPNKAEYQSLLEVIDSRRKRWRTGITAEDSSERHAADTADVIIVDYDLIHYSLHGDTGNTLAYLLRCYTTCGIIVVLNEYGNNVFDLTLGRMDPSFGDLDLGELQLGNVGLWSRDVRGYRPWHWPVIPDARLDFERCVDDAEQSLNERIVEVLELERVLDWIPHSVRERLSRPKRIEELTFLDSVTTSLGGVANKDRLNPHQIARGCGGKDPHLVEFNFDAPPKRFGRCTASGVATP